VRRRRRAGRPGVSFVVFDEPLASCRPCEGAFEDPTFWQKHEAALWLGKLDDFGGDALLLCSFDGLLPGVALIDIRKGYSLARRLLDCFGEAADLGAVIDIGGGDMERQQMAERIDRQMQLGAALALGAVIAGARAAFRSRAQGPAVKDRGYRLCLAAAATRITARRSAESRPWFDSVTEPQQASRKGNAYRSGVDALAARILPRDLRWAWKSS
jgi:hypothetical protein